MWPRDQSITIRIQEFFKGFFLYQFTIAISVDNHHINPGQRFALYQVLASSSLKPTDPATICYNSPQFCQSENAYDDFRLYIQNMKPTKL